MNAGDLDIPIFHPGSVFTVLKINVYGTFSPYGRYLGILGK
jgi:hypothetical protein